MEMKNHEILEQKLCKELEIIESKFIQNPNAEMSAQDLEKVDKIYHALKSMATYNAMKEAEGYEEQGYSGRHMRSPSTGRYISGTGYSMNNGDSYADGYANGYSEAMAQNQSGHYPMMQNNYPPRRW